MLELVLLREVLHENALRRLYAVGKLNLLAVRDEFQRQLAQLLDRLAELFDHLEQRTRVTDRSARPGARVRLVVRSTLVDESR